MKLKCFVVDDEPVARKVLEEFIGDIDYLELVGQAENPVRAISELKDQEVDILFLDINTPKINGIEFLKTTKVQAKVIITTAYPDFALEAYGLEVLDYLVKPISFERFLKACNRVKEWNGQKSDSPAQQNAFQNHFFVKCDNQIEKVFYDELLYAEAMMNYVMFYTTSKKMMVYITIKSLEDQLPSNIFIKVHKSFIVNMNKVKSIEGNVLKVGEEKIGISQNLREKVLNAIVRDKMIKR